MSQEVNPFELAGTGEPAKPPVAPPDEAKVVHPILFEKDYLDFTGTPSEDEPVVPKASSAPVSVATPKSVTGLEDVSEEDLETTAQTSAEKVTTLKPVSGL